MLLLLIQYGFSFVGDLRKITKKRMVQAVLIGTALTVLALFRYQDPTSLHLRHWYYWTDIRLLPLFYYSKIK